MSAPHHPRPAPSRPAAVLFDCDGVLADSEGIVDRLISAEMTERGWALTPAQSGRTFLGLSLPDMVPLIEARTGPLPPGWLDDFTRRVTQTMAREVPPMPGAEALLRRLRQAGLPLALASNSSREELRVKLEKLGFAWAFEGRVFSFQDVERPKPWPDIYRAAAAACGARPEDCAVIEDSVVGVRAGAAAGCRVLAFAGHGAPEALLAAGARETVGRLEELPARLGLLAEAGR
ncbi:HAD family phosphatase [Roseomonas sp. OT10]|uniref:HAD family hydrolase n=1 Tax=Roseomonas cutis TaxID=2897332 RepID=UPI001E481573|nr:HAD family phosphatase [Roseomonas sp. OT10]UFN47133.1 HAD family phosphatase [Roseomonas sp. OT10]